MNILNSSSLTDMLAKCSDTTAYHGIIVFNTRNDLKEFIREFVNLNKQMKIQNIRIIKELHSSGVIEFTNDSSIRLILANTSTRGYKCHVMLFDDTIDEDTKCALSRYLVPYNPDQWDSHNEWARKIMGKWVADDKLSKTDPMENITDTKELDDFLDGFKIASKK